MDDALRDGGDTDLETGDFADVEGDSAGDLLSAVFRGGVKPESQEPGQNHEAVDEVIRHSPSNVLDSLAVVLLVVEVARIACCQLHAADGSARVHLSTGSECASRTG